MLPTLGLFKKIPCPFYPDCPRLYCVFSHDAPPDSVAPEKKIQDVKGQSSKTRPSSTSAIVTSGSSSSPSSGSALGTKRKLPAHDDAKAIGKANAIQRSLTTKRIASDPMSKSKTIASSTSKESLRSGTVTSSATTVPRSAQPSLGKPLSSVTASTSTKTNTVTPSSSTLSQPRTIHRQAHTLVSKGTLSGSPPKILPDLKAHTPLKLRQVTTDRLYDQFLRIYKPILSHQPSLATEHALKQEQAILTQTTNQAGYKHLATTILMRLKKRPAATHATDVGIDGEWIDPASQPALPPLADAAKNYILSHEELEAMGYPLLDQLSDVKTVSQSPVGTTKTCDRCKSNYVVKDVLGEADLTACTYHFGRMRQTMSFGEKQRIYICCSETFGSPGCVKGPHVFKDDDIKEMHAKIPYVVTPATHTGDPSLHKPLVALDCEMAYTTAGMELVRLTAVDEKCNVIIDELVLPSHMVVDLNTRYSGIKTLAGAKHDLESIRNELYKYVNADTVLLGHGLENDMHALRMIHTKIIDTAQLFPHPNGLPYRYGLRVLSTKYLSKFIQTSSEGHDSFEDAKTCVELFQAFLRQHV